MAPLDVMRRELRALVRLAVPVILLQIAIRLMNTVDMAMLGHYSADALAAVSIGNAWFWFSSVFCIGFLMASDPLFSQAVGAGDEAAFSRTMQRGIVWTLLLSGPAILAVFQVDDVLIWSGQPEHLVPDATRYARIVSCSVPSLLLFGVLRSALLAYSRLRALLITAALANVFNAVANYALIFGHFGFPVLGIEGAAWATVMSRTLLTGIVLFVGWPQIGRHVLSFRDRACRVRALRASAMLRVASVGWPIGLQTALELGVFAATTLTVGSLGADWVAAHQVTLDLASMSFMVPVGIGIAVSVRVGNAIGRGDNPAARRSAVAALSLSAVLGAGFAVAFLVAPQLFAAVYTNEATVVAFALVLIPIAGVFQVVDGLQSVAVGVLRGIGDTRMPMVINLLGFWLLGFPAGWVLCFGAGFGAAGMWWGFVVGLTCVAVGLLVLVKVRFRREHVRLVVD